MHAFVVVGYFLLLVAKQAGDGWHLQVYGCNPFVSCTEALSRVLVRTRASRYYRIFASPRYVCVKLKPGCARPRSCTVCMAHGTTTTCVSDGK